MYMFLYLRRGCLAGPETGSEVEHRNVSKLVQNTIKPILVLLVLLCMFVHLRRGGLAGPETGPEVDHLNVLRSPSSRLTIPSY